MDRADILAYRAAGPKERKKLADKYIKQNEMLILKLVQKYSKWAPPGTEWEDLVQAGRLAFFKTLERIDPDISRFSTYYTYWIKNEISKVTERVGTVFVPSRSVMGYKAMQKDHAIQAKHGRLATAEELGVTEAVLKRWREQPQRFPLTETLQVLDEEQGTTEERMIERQDRAEAMECIKELPERDQEMLMRLRRGDSIKEVAKALGMKQQEVRDRLQEIADDS